MKKFFKYTVASMLGFFLCSILITAISFICIAGMAVSDNTTKPIQKDCILRINLMGELDERNADNPLAMLPGNNVALEKISLENLLSALNKAKDNEHIKGIYIEAGALSASPAMVQELRHALLDFKQSGKFVVSYGDIYTKAAYYVASVADSVLLNPIGRLDWSGMAATPMFYKDAMAKLGVKMQVFKVGTFKSAVEPYTESAMSPANREQVQSYLGCIWKNMVNDVAESRGKTPEAINHLADSLIILAKAETSLEGGLVDKLCYIDEVKTILKEKMGLEEDGTLKFVSPKEVANAETLANKVTDEVAIYYAYGEIVETPSGLSNEAVITGDKMVKDLQKLRKDKNVKAVVVRVNSPGGSAYASEQIWREIELLKAEKPVVVSMGGYAASGGYYISCASSLIYAEPNTLTGSIGVFAMMPDPSHLLTNTVGLKDDVVKTNAMSDFGGTMLRPLNDAECKTLQFHVEDCYETFTKRVADGRGMNQDDVKKIAEGRVWTGEQAIELGLVDKLGDLDEAVVAAAELANIEAYSIGRYPGASPWYADLFNKTKKSYFDSQMKAILGDYYPMMQILQKVRSKEYVQARIPYSITIQ